jgi:type I restriction enzyme, S subunit
MADNGWTSATFAELIERGDLTIGDGYRAKNNELGGSGLIFLRAGHVTDSTIDFAGVDRFHEGLSERVAHKIAKAGDAVITTKGNSTGRVTFVGDGLPPFVYSPHLSYWRSRDSKTIVPRFLYYWSRSAEFQTQLRGMSASTDMAPYLSLQDQRRLRIILPPAAVQRRIAEILGGLDDKIELNRRTNETLESTARALFKSWFIDFDPVRAKAAGRGPAKLDATTTALFPARIVDSAYCRLPQGWKAVPLPDAIEVNPERRLSRGAVAPYLEMSNMPTASARAVEWVNREFSSGMRFVNGDVLVARITPCLENGKTAFVDFLAEGQVGWGSTEYIVLRGRPPLPPAFAYFLARTDEFRNHVIQNMTGTSGRQRAPAECLDKYRVVVPSEPISRLFGDLVTPLIAAMKANDEQSKNLADARDALLPRLLSGELTLTA